ncbi:MAG: TonB family protein [Cytophagaceae bacterium]|jgi:protein TonB|nr:TonB family protein [Cytophagaceae bacterium]
METSYEKFEYDDFVFENKNKSFGAYELRETYWLRLLILAGLLLVVYVVGSFLLSWYIKKPAEEVKVPKRKKKIEQIVDVALDTKKPEPPPLKVDPPKVKMIKYVPPKIVKDKDVVKEELPPKQEDMKNINPGNDTQDGVEGELPPADGNGKDPLGEENNDILEIVDEDPEFVGGEDALISFLSKHLRYPNKAIKMGAEGTVYVSFVVEKDGSISGIKIKKGMVVEECNAEATRVVGIMPKWKPARYQGKAVRNAIIIPIRYVLPEDE